MSRIAVIGSGPGAFFTVKYLLKRNLPNLSRIDIFEKLPSPFGLVRFGVAPDHSEVKEVTNEFRSVLKSNPERVKLLVNSEIRDSESLKNLKGGYDAVLIATGAQESKRLPMKILPVNTFSAQDFVLWYNGHPEKQDLVMPEAPRNVSVVGHGNVALDVARMLSKSAVELRPLVEAGLLTRKAHDWFATRQALQGLKSVSIFGRRGYLDAAFTNKEFRELTTMSDAVCRVDESELEDTTDNLREKTSADRAKSRGLSILSKCVTSNGLAKSNEIFLRFFCKPIEYVGNPAREIIVENVSGCQESVSIEMGIESIGFRVSENLGLPMDQTTGGVAHDGRGRVLGWPGFYVSGWAKRGPKGVIAANIPCSIETAEAMHEDLLSSSRH